MPKSVQAQRGAKEGRLTAESEPFGEAKTVFMACHVGIFSNTTDSVRLGKCSDIGNTKVDLRDSSSES